MTQENPTPPPIPQYYSPIDPNIEMNPEARSMAMLCHLLGIFTGFVGPLIVWLLQKDRSPFVDHQGKQSINFQITIAIAYIVSFPLMFICIGYLTFLATFVAHLTFGIIGTVQAGRGIPYRYPVAIPFLT